MTTLKIAAIACVRDEADVIESFVRHNLNYVDRLFVIDNLSRDGTQAILAHLAGEGLPVSWGTSAHMDHAQENVLTNAVRSFPQMGHDFDFVVPLDADEFIGSPDRRTFEHAIDQLDEGEYGVAPWKTYVPAASQAAQPVDADAMLTARMQFRRAREPHTYFKAIIPTPMMKDAVISPGSHALIPLHPGVRIVQRELPVPIAHFPVRSTAQVVAKVVLGSHTLSMKKTRLDDEGLHWDEMARLVRSQDYRLSPEQLERMALDYAANGQKAADELVRDPMPLHAAQRLRYSAWGEDTALRAFDNFIARMIENCEISHRPPASA